MFLFVLHCQQRPQYEADVRKRENLPADELVKVPSPGMPFNYLGMPVPRRNESSDDMQQEATTDSIVDESMIGCRNWS